MLNLKKSSVSIFLLILLLFRPTIIIKFSTIDKIVSLLGNCISIYALFMWMIHNFKVDKWLLHLGVFCLTLLVCTIINDGKLNLIFAVIRIFAGALIIDRLAEKNGDRFFDITKYALAFLVIVNLLSMILFPNGIIQITREANEWSSYEVSWWLFGNKNGMFLWLFPLTFLSEISILQKKKNKRYCDICFLILCILTAFISKSSTTLFILLMILIFPLIFKLLKSGVGNIKPWMILFIYLSINLLLVFSSHLGIFSFFAGLFGKDSTFTGRTTAWTNSVLLFLQKPILGYGLLDADTARAYLGAYAFVNSHNTLLQVLISGGLLLCVQYIMLLHMLLKKNCEVENNDSAFFAMIIWTLFMLSIQSCFEANADSILYWNILTIIYCIIRINSRRKDRNEFSE